MTLLLSQAGLPLIAGAAFVAVVAALLVIAGSVIPRRTLAVLVYGAVVVAVAGVVRSADPASSLLAGWGGSRYFLFGVFAIIAIVDRLDRGRRPLAAYGRAWRSAILLSVGVIWDFQILAPPTLGWAENSACIGGADHASSRSSRWRLGHPLAGTLGDELVQGALGKPAEQEVLGPRPIVGDQRARTR